MWQRLYGGISSQHSFVSQYSLVSGQHSFVSGRSPQYRTRLSPDREGIRAIGDLPAREEGRYKATWKREFKLPWSEAGPPNHLDDKMDSDQWVVNKELSLPAREEPRSRCLRYTQDVDLLYTRDVCFAHK